MTSNAPDLVDHLLARVRHILQQLPDASSNSDASTRFADVFDSMAFVEFLAVVAVDCGVSVSVIEEAAGRQFSTVAELARAMTAAGLRPGSAATPDRKPLPLAPAYRPILGWLSPPVVELPATVQCAEALDVLLGRPPGWLRQHAGIRQRRIWADDDPLAAAARAARECLARAGRGMDACAALLVTSEASPQPLGLAAALHHRLGLAASIPALEIGGACTGFVNAMWMGLRLLQDRDIVLLVAIEAPSRWLRVTPGPAGEAAALFGDGAAACLLSRAALAPNALALCDVLLGTDGSASDLLRLTAARDAGVELHMRGEELATRALTALADSTLELTSRNQLAPADLAALVIHAGNGRIPPLLARRLELSSDRVHSTTAETGNLGAVSLPVTWTTLPEGDGPIAGVAVGAGLQWGAVLARPAQSMPGSSG